MSAMRIPTFTAEAGLGRSSRAYRSPPTHGNHAQGAVPAAILPIDMDEVGGLESYAAAELMEGFEEEAFDMEEEQEEIGLEEIDIETEESFEGDDEEI